MPFPPESRAIYTHLMSSRRQHNPKIKAYHIALASMEWAENSPYGFEDNLLTGNYAAWPHEVHSGKIQRYNCTTIIPEVYLQLEEFGLKPEIVQFVHCRTKKCGEKEYSVESHFAVIVDLGKPQPYLIDPFQHLFGPIHQRGKHFMRVGRRLDYPPATREYSQLLTYSEEEFVALMERMRDPADSLDMLVAGQKLYKHRDVRNVKCGLMVYYDDFTNVISTRSNIPQVARQSKLIRYILPATEEGEFQEGRFELSYAEGQIGWKEVQGEVTLARLDHTEIQRLSRLCRKSVYQSSRLGHWLDHLDKSSESTSADKHRRDELYSLAELLWGRLTAKEKADVEPKVLARTIYEGTHVEREHHFSEVDHKKRLVGLLQHVRELDSLKSNLLGQLHDHNWKIDRLPLEESRRVRSQYQKILREEETIDESLREIKDLYYYRRKEHDRVMDQVLFAEHLRPLSLEQRKKVLTEQGLDFRLGYIAMVGDFLPYLSGLKREMQLELFRSNLTEKIKARRAKRNAKV